MGNFLKYTSPLAYIAFETYDYFNEKNDKEYKSYHNLYQMYRSCYNKSEYSSALSILERLKNNYEKYL